MVGPRPAAIRKFQRELLAWFDSHARDLPWRRSGDPYQIWVSEIMLQQTRVTAVLDYYSRFLALFPTLAALALAEEPAVLAAWSGLGYYRRARMMHGAARVVVREHQGVLPKTAKELRKLPGIGEYTSSAIASIAFGERVAVVDGNVERVLRRVFPEGETAATPAAQAKWLRDRAASLVDPQRPGDFNQSMMELGATVCLPQRPLCLQCPVQPFCATRGEHQGPPPKKMRSRQIAYALMPPRSGGPNAGATAAASLIGLADAGHVGTPGSGDAARRSPASRDRTAPCHHRNQLSCSGAALLRGGSYQPLAGRAISSPMGREFGAGQLAVDRTGTQDPPAVADHAHQLVIREVR